jgi:hypothetical protein
MTKTGIEIRNAALAEAIVRSFLSNPDHCEMNSWVCGTQRCIGGEALYIARGQEFLNDALRMNSVAFHARRELELSYDHMNVYNRIASLSLFDVGQWPDPYQTEYLALPDGEGYFNSIKKTDIVCRLIEDSIVRLPNG